MNNHDLTDVSIIKITIWRDSSVGVVVRSRKGMVIVTYDNDGIIIETPTLKYRVVPNDHSKTGDIAKLENRIKWARETFDELSSGIAKLPMFSNTLSYSTIGDAIPIK